MSALPPLYWLVTGYLLGLATAVLLALVVWRRDARPFPWERES